MQPVYKLKGVIQHYSWGGKDFIPSLLQSPNTENQPCAEYWVGAHPKASAIVVNENCSLQQIIAGHPAEILGEETATKFGSLPYLFKILDVVQMLSIQVHPSKEAAKIGYAEEDAKGIALNATDRNYKDENHKPELMVALGDFWLLHGFKEEKKLEQIFANVPQLQFLTHIFKSGGYKAMYEEVMTMPQERVDQILTSLMHEIVPKYNQGALQKNDEHFWAARAALNFCTDGHYDRGIFSIYLFNLLHLKEGEGIYQPAGLPHAYLEGQNVEVMANSDNVLRAGLTDKHVDVPELMKHVKFEATLPKIIRNNNETEQSFEAPVEEFFLKKYSGNQSFHLAFNSAAILFIYEGEAQIISGETKLFAGKGEAFFILAGKKVLIQSATQLTFFSLTTPSSKN